MKKNELKNFLKVLILFASIVSTISCEKNEIEDLTNRKMSSENISKNQLLDELNDKEIIEFVSKSKYFTNSNDLLKNNQTSFSNSDSPNFQKIVKPNEYITYSLRLNSYTSQKPYFEYFVINKEISGIEKAGFVKYLPSSPSHELDVDYFTGDIEIYNTDNELFAKTTFQNGQPASNNSYNSNSTTFSSNYTVSSCYNVSYIIAHPCSHNGGHMPGESCTNGLVNDAYYEIRTTIVCIDTIKSIVPPDTFGGGGGGGGGATILNLLNIPEPYEGEPSFSNESFMFYQQIFNFLQANPAYNNLVNHRYANNCLVSDWIVPKVVDYFRYNSFVEQQNQINVINAMNMFTNFLEIVSNQYNHEEMFVNQFQTFQFLLQNSQWLSSQTNQTRQEIFNYLLSNNLNEQSRVFVKEVMNYLISNPAMSWKIVMNNRTSFDTNQGEVDNYSQGGYDTNTYESFNPQQQSWPSITTVIPQNKFVGWNTNLHPNWQCMEYSKEQLRVMGYQISSYYATGQTFQIYTAQNGVNNTVLSHGLSYLKYALSNGIPVIVGVDDAPGHPGNRDSTTDHFIVLVGMGTDSNGKYFQFYDNASSEVSQGANSLNKLYYNSTTGIISGSSQTDYANRQPRPYTITMIRKSKPL